MSNLYNNEVIFNGQTLMSLKEDTVTPDKVLAGETFHDRSGAPQTGSLITHNVYDGLDSTSANDALSANQGRVLKSNIDQLNRHNTSRPNAVISRITHLTGGYKKIGSAIIFNVTFKAVASATNSPQIYAISDSLVPIIDTAFSCIDITNGIATAIGGGVPCGISTAGRIYIQKIETNHIYAMTGVYITAGTL